MRSILATSTRIFGLSDVKSDTLMISGIFTRRSVSLARDLGVVSDSSNLMSSEYSNGSSTILFEYPTLFFLGDSQGESLSACCGAGLALLEPTGMWEEIPHTANLQPAER